MYYETRKAFPNIPLYADLEHDAWDIRRGKQTIELKEAAPVGSA
jgi:hypothetical protein